MYKCILSERNRTIIMGLRRRNALVLVKVGVFTCLIAAVFITLVNPCLPSMVIRNIFTNMPVGDNLRIQSGGGRVIKSSISVNFESNLLEFSGVHSGKSSTYLQIIFPHKILDVDTEPEGMCSGHKIVNRSGDGLDDTYRGQRSSVPVTCLYFEEDLSAAIYDDAVAGLQCHYIQWSTGLTTFKITNYLALREDNWYGGGILTEQDWPLQRVNVPLQPYMTNKFSWADETTKFSSFIEPYFVSANGVALMFDSYLPLFMSINADKQNHLVFQAAFSEPYSPAVFSNTLSLRYTVCKDDVARLIHQRLSKLRLPSPGPGPPEENLLRLPIWSTSWLGAEKVDEQELNTLVHKLTTEHNLPHSQIYIHGRFSSGKGMFFFDGEKVPRSRQLIADWMGINIYTVAGVSPHLPSWRHDSHRRFVLIYKKFARAKRRGLKPFKPEMLLDVTNQEAIDFYLSLMEFSQGVNYFLFKDGHAGNVFPPGISQSDIVTNSTLYHPNFYTKLYADIAARALSSKVIKGAAMLGSGYAAQKYNLIVDIGPFHSNWDFIKGLKAVIPSVITMGLMGYPFVLAGPVGGLVEAGAVSKSTDTNFIKRALFLRWLNLAVYLPALEIAWPPWVFHSESLEDNEVNYTRTLLEFRRDVLWPRYLAAAVGEAASAGTPIVRPLWWVAPYDKTAQYINCEFMLGSRLLVAPVLDPVTHRSVYLPQGSQWRDNLRDKVYEGGQWLQGYEANYYETPTFERLAEDGL